MFFCVNKIKVKAGKAAGQTGSLPCVERLSEVINLLKHTDRFESGMSGRESGRVETKDTYLNWLCT